MKRLVLDESKADEESQFGLTVVCFVLVSPLCLAFCKRNVPNNITSCGSTVPTPRKVATLQRLVGNAACPAYNEVIQVLGPLLGPLILTRLLYVVNLHNRNFGSSYFLTMSMCRFVQTFK